MKIYLYDSIESNLDLKVRFEMSNESVNCKLVSSVVELVNKYRARASQSDSANQARVVTFDSAVNFLVKFAADEQIRRFDKAIVDAQTRKLNAQKSAWVDAYAQAVKAKDEKRQKELLAELK